jgi:hypothetical protein
MFGERAALIIAGTTRPQGAQEELLLYAYECAALGIPLLKTYLNVPHPDKMFGEHLDAFMLGYSTGATVFQFSDSSSDQTPN